MKYIPAKSMHISSFIYREKNNLVVCDGIQDKISKVKKKSKTG